MHRDGPSAPQPVVHEIGHALQLPHSCSDRAVGFLAECTKGAVVMRTAPIGPPEDLAVNFPVDNDIAHILGVGESVTLGNVHIAVLGREGDTFTVSVTGTTYDFTPLRR
jgi:hypothetical protein